MKSNILLILCSILTLNSCTLKKEKDFCANKSGENIKSIPNENFDEFNNSFYSDSLFQISRIIFPLVGEVNGSDSIVSDEHKLKKEDWVILKNNYFKNGNDTAFVIHGEHFKGKMHKANKMVVQEVYIENSGYKSEMKFSLKNGKWYLTDYVIWNY